MPSSAAEGESPLVERERELAQLDRGIARALAGEGTPLLIEGPPGIGKTSLLRAAIERALRSELEVLKARATTLERELPFGVVRQLFERLPTMSSGSTRHRCTSSATWRGQATHKRRRRPRGAAPRCAMSYG